MSRRGAYALRMTPPGRATLVAYLALALVVTVPVLVLAAPYVLPLLLAAILAAICAPLVDRLRARGMRPWLAAGLVTMAVLAGVLGPIAGVLYAATRQAITGVQSLSANPEFGVSRLVEAVTGWGPARRLFPNPEDLTGRLSDLALQAGQWVSNVALRTLAGLPEWGLVGALTAIALFFFLLDGARAWRWVCDRLPVPTAIRDALARAFVGAAIATVMSSMAAAAAQSAVILVAWAGLTGSLVDNIVRPWVLQGREAMHPLVSLVVISGGIDHFGLLGVFIGPVLAGLALAVWDIWPVVARHCGVAVGDDRHLDEVVLEER